MNTQLIILAAGKGTRMGEASVPKVLLPLNNKPVIGYLTEEIKKLNLVYPTILVVGYKYDLVQKALGPKYIYAFQQGQLGTAHAVDAGLKHASEKNVLVLCGDIPFIKAESLQRLIDKHNTGASPITMFVTEVPNFENQHSSFMSLGRIIRNDNKEIIAIRELLDATAAEAQIRELNSGIYIFDREWLEKNISLISNNNKQNEFYLTDIVEIAISQGKVVNSLPVAPKEVFGINTLKDLKQVEQAVING
jgi:bifunctional UDP-N-acetylglucosamine pyrophosphorylase/glucosamine-1-phosphate N-acetyltransferase